MLAKLACGLNKPNKQTILPHEQLAQFFPKLDIDKLRGLGGKLGEKVNEKLGVKTVGELSRLTLTRIKEDFEVKTAQWLFNLSRGLEFEPVKERDLPKSVGCSKNFLGIESQYSKFEGNLFLHINFFKQVIST